MSALDDRIMGLAASESDLDVIARRVATGMSDEEKLAAFDAMLRSYVQGRVGIMRMRLREGRSMTVTAPRKGRSKWAREVELNELDALVHTPAGHKPLRACGLIDLDFLVESHRSMASEHEATALYYDGFRQRLLASGAETVGDLESAPSAVAA